VSAGAVAATAATRFEHAGPRLSIGVLSYGLPVVGAKRGGIERVAHDLANGLAGRGHRVVVFSHDGAPAGAKYEVKPLPWRRFVSTWIGRRATMGYLGNVLMALPDFSGLDVLMAHGDSLLLPLRRLPFVRVVHGSAWEEARSATSIGRFLLQTGVFAQELLGAATHRASVGVSENTRRSNPFVRFVVPNGVNRAVFTPSPADRAPYPMVLSVGAMTGRKRGWWLLEAFESEIAPRVPGVQLHFVSPPGPARPNVTYHEGVSDVELARLYRQAWVYASPSTYEGFGLPYIESMACGTPVVATPNAGSREVLADGAGILAPDEHFTPTVVNLLTNTARRNELSARGLARAATYDMERALEAYERLLTNIVTATETTARG
jgi:phosphatidyl-myo-inositol alpha-mannosyltransferase